MKRIGIYLLSAVAVNVALINTTPIRAQEDKGKVIPAAARQNEFDQPIAWLQEAKRNYTLVKDYTCTMVSQENVGGKMREQDVIQFKMKTEPFSVYLRWIDGPNKGQEVAYVHGKNNNKMRVKSPILKVLGFMSIDVNDKRVTQHSRHTILEAGMGNMIEQHITQWENDRNVGKARVMPIAQHVYAGRQCYKIEIVRNPDPRFYCHRTVLYLEKESKMPIRLENYDWPRQAGADGVLLEMYGYVNLQFNVGLKDVDFVK